MRQVAIGKQPLRYLDTFEDALRALDFTESEVQGAAAVLVKVILGLALQGSLRGSPEYLQLDRRRAGFSYYFFADDVVEGVYSASGDVVHLEYLAFAFDDDVDASAIIARLDVEASFSSAAA